MSADPGRSLFACNSSLTFVIAWSSVIAKVGATAVASITFTISP